ncbi:hypothetical protein ACFWFX_01215, partial [Streptomyces roseolus]|uniref:hypothetical protein n=1 Tax=Streptomyces roseolus TaxID=67358 RepID=UPI003655EC93
AGPSRGAGRASCRAEPGRRTSVLPGRAGAPDGVLPGAGRPVASGLSLAAADHLGDPDGA